ncbi:MAG: hypothetical protein LBF83_07995 [Spirochaetaceae bacterium]|nr:hypothetical protein [Spirochaetaceae bacterium]
MQDKRIELRGIISEKEVTDSLSVEQLENGLNMLLKTQGKHEPDTF